jgi:membrane carboxypeptidase/penicillin-binding protein PbpC
LVSDILSDDAAREIGFGLNSVLQIGRPAAVKTGTTTNFHDNWTVGYTPDLIVGVWAGNANHEAMHNINGLTGAAPIWAEFMRTVLNGRPERSFTRPPGLTQVEVCSLSGLLPTPDCPYQRLEWFIDGTQPTQKDTLYREVTLDAATGLPATAQTPPQQQVTHLALDLPAQAIPWAHTKGLLVYSELMATQATSGSSQPGGLTFLSPADRSIYHLAAGLSSADQRVQIQLGGSPALKGVTLWIDGKAVKTFAGSPFEYWWALEEGTHTLRAMAADAEGGSVEAEVTIQVKP